MTRFIVYNKMTYLHYILIDLILVRVFIVISSRDLHNRLTNGKSSITSIMKIITHESAVLIPAIDPAGICHEDPYSAKQAAVKTCLIEG